MREGSRGRLRCAPLNLAERGYGHAGSGSSRASTARSWPGSSWAPSRSRSASLADLFQGSARSWPTSSWLRECAFGRVVRRDLHIVLCALNLPVVSWLNCFRPLCERPWPASWVLSAYCRPSPPPWIFGTAFAKFFTVWCSAVFELDWFPTAWVLHLIGDCWGLNCCLCLGCPGEWTRRADQLQVDAVLVSRQLVDPWIHGCLWGECIFAPTLVLVWPRRAEREVLL